MKHCHRFTLPPSALFVALLAGAIAVFSIPAAMRAQGNALGFDGIDDILGAAPVLTAPPLTLEAWAMWSCPNPDLTDEMIAYNGKTGVDGYGIVLQRSISGEYHYAALIGGKMIIPGPVAVEYEWDHLALVNTGNDHWFFYLNGAQYDLDTAAMQSPTTSFTIGNSSDTTMPYFGEIDEVRISSSARYTGPFLPPTTTFTPDVSTALLYHFDEASVDTTADASGGGNTGHLGAPPHDPAWMISCVPLPIQLAQFSGSLALDGGVNLEWSTFSEVNNYGFFVERKLPAEKDYRTVSQLIPGAGTSLEKHGYSWTDRDVSPGVYNYRLQQVDLNGKVNHSSAIRVVVGSVLAVDPAKPLVFSLHQNFPNPFNPSTSITFSLPREEQVALKVYDMSGRVVATLAGGMKRAGEYKIRWDARNFPSGIYFYRLIAGSFTETRKMTVIQ